jgi:hypothetical protein
MISLQTANTDEVRSVAHIQCSFESDHGDSGRSRLSLDGDYSGIRYAMKLSKRTSFSAFDLLNFFDLALRVTRGKAVKVDGSTGTSIANSGVTTSSRQGQTRSYKVRQFTRCI